MENNLKDKIVCFSDDFDVFTAKFSTLKTRMENILLNYQIDEFRNLQKDILKFQKIMTTSLWFTEYSKHKTLQPKVNTLTNECHQTSINKINEDFIQVFKEKYDKNTQMLEEALKNEKLASSELKEKLDAVNLLHQDNSDEEEKNELSLCQGIYNQEVNETPIFSKNTSLDLDCSQANVISFMNKASKSKNALPVLRRVNFQKPVDNNSDIRDFISFCFPPKIKFLWINLQYTSIIDTNYYEDAIKSALPKVTNEIYFYWARLTKEFFEEAVKASANCKRLVFDYWYIFTDSECNFSGPKYATHYIGFQFTGHNGYSTWETIPNRFENIVKGIKSCSLKESLEFINVLSCGITKEQAQQILNNNGLSYIEAVETRNSALNF
jgi:hypothetical protein